jgi:Asp/Glu/hydantoin racemase
MEQQNAKPIRIWYQSFVDPAEQAPYMDRLKARLAKVASPGVSFDVVGLVPPDRHFHAITEFRCAGGTIHSALAAERAGYDAFVIGHFQEPGLTEAKGAVDIPVIGLGEATMLHACAMGRRFGLVTISPAFIPWHEEQVRRHGLESRCAGIAAITADLPRFMAAFDDPAARAALRADLLLQMAPLRACGADVLIPAGGLPMLLLADDAPLDVEGAALLEGIATVAKAAEMAVALRRLTGLGVSRGGLYAKATAGAIADFLGETRATAG